ncbi:MAG: hypothetical protein K9W45_01075 [Candidatus Heimdallarchaeum aukensis]|uniref:Uncharacterized protein n=1 Tax=Candidatus Heimdallarchaeum aukensis TaxID=2876573 RepID=A0A9Y1FKW8_9ARCH|nr:MAG: hypothetical protein K9W45_01075 [Candidatus Heimdallarchaeum aukensis]
MNEVSLSSLILSILLFIFSLTLTYQSIFKKRKTWFFNLAVYLSFLLTLSEVVRSAVTGKDLSLILITIALIIWSLIYILLFLFFQQLVSNTINPILTIVIFLFYFIEIEFGILQFFDYPGIINYLYILLWDLGYDSLGFIIFIYGAIVHFRILKRSKNIEAGIITSALIVIAFGFVWGFTIDFFIFLENIGVLVSSNFLSIIKKSLLSGDIIKALGILVFTGVYVFRPNYIFKHPFKIDSLIIYNRIGLPIYGAKYTKSNTEEEKEITEKKSYHFELIGGAINALSEFIITTAGSKKKLNEINTEDKIIKIVSTDLCSIVVMSDKISFFLIQSMKRVVNLITKKYPKELEEKHLEDDIFPDIKKMIKDSFPFLPKPVYEYS